MSEFNDGIEAAADEVLRWHKESNIHAPWIGGLAEAIRALKRPEPGEAVPADVRRLVVAARIVAFEDQGPEALRELDQASEAFADLVPWDNEPAVLKAMEQGQ